MRCLAQAWRLRLKLQARRMLPPAQLRNQFDTLGKSLAQYLSVLSLSYVVRQAIDRQFEGPMPRPALTKFGEISLELLKPGLCKFRKCLLIEGFQS